MKKIITYTLFGVLALPLDAIGAEEKNLDDLGNLSLESLGKIVTSVSRKPEDSFRSAAAIYVITNDDIKASGATHIAEVLRGVPGLDVARVDSSNWAISSRGFNGFFANKLLILVDGRAIYKPMFSGVYWDIQNMPLEDIDRVEVIRGPGASLWGANAVNGVINIITKNAGDTQGIYLNQIVGNQDRSLTDARYGGKIGENAYYRVYGEFTDRAATPLPGGSDNSGHNQWYAGKAGFRSDWNVSGNRKIMLQGDVYNADINLDLSVPSFTDPSGYNSYHDHIHSYGFNILGRWEEKHSDTLQSTFQTYLDSQSPNYSSLQQTTTTLDFDYQTLWKANNRNEIMWGAGARYINMDLLGTFDISIKNPVKDGATFNAFAQDQIALIPQEIYLTLGSKFEHNSFTGFEVEPSARIAWYPDSKQTVWAAVSRAVRIPNVIERSLTLNLYSVPPSTIVQETGNLNFVSEELVAYEIGYRIKPVSDVTIDTTAFINDYNKLSTLEPLAEVVTGAGTFQPYQFNNLGKGQSYGFETSANWDVTARWNLMANYSYINLVLDDSASQDPSFDGQKGNIPHHQFMLRSQLFLPHDLRFVNTGYYVGRLPNQDVDPYFRFDTQVMWKATDNIELSLVGQNLLEPRHLEFGALLGGGGNEIPRAFYGRVTFRY